MNLELSHITDFDYDLPDDRIARFPVEPRDAARLLFYDKGKLSNSTFAQLDTFLQKGDLIVFNDTRVIPARIQFMKDSGGQIEVFCLEPVNQSAQEAMSSKGKSLWRCLVGGARKWKGDTGLILNCDDNTTLFAKKVETGSDHFIIEFHWKPDKLTFSEILLLAGSVPLPPYFNRKALDIDLERYQTVFAKYEGSVAAPTAALHFTDQLIERISGVGVESGYVTLHVGAGTFKPISSDDIKEHEMHAESFSVHLDLIRKILNQGNNRIIPVGTTSMRTLESLYWIGLKLIEHSLNIEPEELFLSQWTPYSSQVNIPLRDSLTAIIEYCNLRGLSGFSAKTSVMIVPGYRFKVCSGLITNFHMPKSTLIVLVSALVGKDWKKIYDYALQNEYNFLSYGDGSLLIPS